MAGFATSTSHNPPSVNLRDRVPAPRGRVEAVDLTTGKVKLASKSTARRIILEQTGKLKAPSILAFDHARYLGAEPPAE